MFKEAWYYDGYHFVFQSVNGVDGWGFAGEVGPSSTVDVTRAAGRGSFGSSPRRSRTSRSSRSSIPRSQRILDEYYDIKNRSAFKKVEAHFVDPFHSRKYTLPHQITAFRAGKNMRMEIAYAIPTGKLKANDDQMIVMDEGLFMFDYLWRDLYRNVRPIGQKRPSGKNAQQYLLSRRAMTLPQGTYNVVVEVGDRTSGSIGTFRTERLLTVSQSSLDMSDLLLAQNNCSQSFPKKRPVLSYTHLSALSHRANRHSCII